MKYLFTRLRDDSTEEGSGDEKPNKKKTSAEKVSPDAQREKEFAALKAKVDAFEKRDADSAEFGTLKQEFDALVKKYSTPSTPAKESFWGSLRIFDF